MTTPGTLHLVIGPIGAGKTTYAQQKAARIPAVFLDLDTWMVRLFGADLRPEQNVMAWYMERRDRCRGLLWDMTLNVLRCGTDVVLEAGLLSITEREAFYSHARDEGVHLTIYLLDAPRDVRRERVAERNRLAGPFTQIVPMEFFERASDTWQPPQEEERTVWGIIAV